VNGSDSKIGRGPFRPRLSRSRQPGCVGGASAGCGSISTLIEREHTFVRSASSQEPPSDRDPGRKLAGWQLAPAAEVTYTALTMAL
jgi:hypothetical protein